MPPLNTRLWHVTAATNLPSIRREGLRPKSYWSACPDLAHYYATTVRDEGHSPAFLSISLSRMLPRHLAPDLPGIEEPIMTVVRTLGSCATEEAISRAWQRSKRRWRDSLRLIGSVRYMAPIPWHCFSVSDRL